MWVSRKMSRENRVFWICQVQSNMRKFTSFEFSWSSNLQLSRGCCCCCWWCGTCQSQWFFCAEEVELLLFFSLRIRLKCNDQSQMHFSLKFFGHEFFCFSLEIWYFGNVNSITDIWNCSGQRLMNWSERKRKWKSFIICTHSAITDNYSDNYLMLLEYYNRDGLIWYHIQYDQKWWHQQYDTKKRWIF